MQKLTFDYQPTVSIVLCTYNRADYLTRCIDSVLAQTYRDWELIVVDDGSSDNTFPLVDKYLQQHANFRYVKHKNRKAALSKNVGITASFGQYITFIDSDDAYLPEHIENRVDFMVKNPEMDILEGGIELDEDFLLLDFFHPNQLINIKDCIFGATFFGKRHVYFDLKGFNNLPYGEDTDFWFRAEQRFKTVKLDAPKTYIYTRAETSITKDATQHFVLKS